jgi:hypothetical protein
MEENTARMKQRPWSIHSFGSKAGCILFKSEEIDMLTVTK